MELITKKNYEELSKAVGDFVIDYVGKKPDSLICFAGGDTPLGLLKYLVEAVQENKVDLGKCKFVGLDEWDGLGRDVKGSCQEMLYNNFYDLINIAIHYTPVIERCIIILPFLSCHETKA